MALSDGWLTPDWPAPPNVRATCTTRAGGSSRSPYDSFNLGDHVGDDPAVVASNRAAFAQALAVQPVFLQQVHGRETVHLALGTADGTQADACITRTRGTACTIMVADCLPVLFTTRAGDVVAAAHAGWRGLAGHEGTGILESVVARLGASSGDLLVWMGPCIGPEAFEVGPDVRQVFEMDDPGSASMFKPCGPGKWLADLPGLARRRLQALGITQIHGNDGSRSWCTVSNPSIFFSHRRDRISGRFAACIWLR